MKKVLEGTFERTRRWMKAKQQLNGMIVVPGEFQVMIVDRGGTFKDEYSSKTNDRDSVKNS